MLVQLNQWGNSLGIRIPKKYRERLGLSKGTKVETSLKDNSIVVSPLKGSPMLEKMAGDIDLDEPPARNEMW
jgi:antitoxin MazE